MSALKVFGILLGCLAVTTASADSLMDGSKIRRDFEFGRFPERGQWLSAAIGQTYQGQNTLAIRQLLNLGPEYRNSRVLQVVLRAQTARGHGQANLTVNGAQASQVQQVGVSLADYSFFLPEHLDEIGVEIQQLQFELRGNFYVESVSIQLARQAPQPPRPIQDLCVGSFVGRMSTGKASTVNLSRAGFGGQVQWSNTYEGQTYFGQGTCEQNREGFAQLRVSVNNGQIVQFEGTISADGQLIGEFVGHGVRFMGRKNGGFEPVRPVPGVDLCNGSYSGVMSTGRASVITLTRSGRFGQVTWSNTYEGQTYFGQGVCNQGINGSVDLRVEVNNGQIVVFEGVISSDGQLQGGFTGHNVSFAGRRI